MTNKRYAPDTEGDGSNSIQGVPSTDISGDQTGSDQSVTCHRKISLLNCFSSSQKASATSGKTKKTRCGGQNNDLDTKVTNSTPDTNIQHSSLHGGIKNDANLFPMVRNKIDGTKKTRMRNRSISVQSSCQSKSKDPKNVEETKRINHQKLNPPPKIYRDQNRCDTETLLNFPFNTNFETLCGSGKITTTNSQTPVMCEPTPDSTILKSDYHSPSKTPSNGLVDSAGNSAILRQHSLDTECNRKPRSSRRDKDRGRARSAFRERSRVEELSQGYQKLQAAIPAVPKNTKLAKLDVLILAASYINHLTRLLKEDEGAGVCDGSLSTDASPPSNNCCQKHTPIKIPEKRWPMRARLYAAVGASPRNATLCSGGGACSMASHQKSVAHLPPRPQDYYKRDRTQEGPSTTIQNKFPKEASLINGSSYTDVLDRLSTSNNCFDISSRPASMHQSFSGHHDLIDFSNCSVAGGKSLSGNLNTENNIYEPVYDIPEKHHVEVESSFGIHPSTIQTFVVAPNNMKMNRDWGYTFSNPEYDFPVTL